MRGEKKKRVITLNPRGTLTHESMLHRRRSPWDNGRPRKTCLLSERTGKSADPTASLHGNTNDGDEAWNSSLSRPDLTYTLSAREMLG